MLKKKYRLTSGDIRRFFNDKKFIIRGRLFVVRVFGIDNGVRFGVFVGRKIVRRAYLRNYIRRVVYMFIRLNLNLFEGVDGLGIVFILKNSPEGSRRVMFQMIRDDVLDLLKKVKERL